MSGFICDECGWHGNNPESVMIPMYANRDEAIDVCPKCRCVKSSLSVCCEEPGCKNEASCGTPHQTGYKRHCHLHPPNAQVDRAGGGNAGQASTTIVAGSESNDLLGRPNTGDPK
jgi:hypothetical protein